MFCAYAGLELEDCRFSSRQEFLDLKEDGTLPFGQVPLLEVVEPKNDDGTQSVHKLVQSNAILRYLATISGQWPTNDPILAAKIDALMDQETDMFTGTTVATYTTRFGIILDDENKQKCMDMIVSEVLPRHLASIERQLKASATGWIAGTERPTPADFIYYSKFAHYIASHDALPEKLRTLQDYPEIQKFVDKVSSLEQVKSYYAAKK